MFPHFITAHVMTRSYPNAPWCPRAVRRPRSAFYPILIFVDETVHRRT